MQVMINEQKTEMSFEQIYAKYKRPIYHYVMKHMGGRGDSFQAEELMNDIFVKAHKNLHTYKVDQYAFSTWLFTIAKNSVIDFLRKKHLQTVSLQDVYIEWANGEEEAQTDHLYAIRNTELNPEDSMIEDELSQAILKKFAILNEAEKLIATHYYFDGLSYDEIAEKLKMPLGTIKAKLHNARATMMDALPTEYRKTTVAAR